jgi:hypothetical protein
MDGLLLTDISLIKVEHPSMDLMTVKIGTLIKDLYQMKVDGIFQKVL